MEPCGMSSRRAEFRAALIAILDDWRTANPGIVRQTYRARPASFAPPLAYVGPFTEPTIELEFGNRLNRPDLRGSLIVVQGVYDNAETLDKLDVMADSLLTYLVTQHSRVSGSTLLEPIAGGEDIELTVGEATYAATLIPVHLNAVD
jgi:hypothetical protein